MTRKHKSDGDRSKVGSSLLVVGGLRSHCGDGEMGDTWRIRDKNKNKLITIIVGKTQIYILKIFQEGWTYVERQKVLHIQGIERNKVSRRHLRWKKNSTR